MSHLFLFFLLLYSVCHADESNSVKPKPLSKDVKLEQLELKSVSEIQPFATEKIELNIKPINLNSSLEGLLEKENVKQKKTPKILREGFTLGKFQQTTWGDYQHLEIIADGNKKSFWCGKDCEKLSNLKDHPSLLVFWREVELFVPEAGEKIRRLETTQIFIDRKILTCSIHKKLPHVSKGCEGEACGVLKYPKAVRSVDIYKNPNKGSSKIGRLERCEKIGEFEPYIVLEGYGLAEVVKSNEQLDKLGVVKGDIIPVINSLGEGYLDACVGEQKIDAVDSGADPSGKQATLSVLQYNKSESWIKLKLPSGLSGYVPEDQNFYMGYYGYSPEYLCPEDHPCGKDFLTRLKSVETRLTESFRKYCQIRKGCQSSDSINQCQLSKDVWTEISSIFPKNIQCAGFGVSAAACKDSWGGSFSCVCPNNEQRNLSYSYSCKTTGESKNCSMDAPFEL